jgi:SAM-dependent methyltransferase
MRADVTAIDISALGVKLTKKRAEYNSVLVNALVMRGDPTSFKNESFDAIHAFGILHHVGLENGLNEVSRLLRPGGRALFFEHMGN